MVKIGQSLARVVFHGNFNQEEERFHTHTNTVLVLERVLVQGTMRVSAPKTSTEGL
jgi:hypothetical protein